MKPRWRPAPSSRELEDLRVHEVVRDYPETLAVFRGEGLDLPALGCELLGQAADERLLTLLTEACSWRGEPS